MRMTEVPEIVTDLSVGVWRKDAVQCRQARLPSARATTGVMRKSGKPGAEVVVEAREGFGAAEFGGAIVNDGARGEKLEDGFAAGLVPDFLEPTEEEMFALLGDGKGMRRGHGNLQERNWREYTERNVRREERVLGGRRAESIEL